MTSVFFRCRCVTVGAALLGVACGDSTGPSVNADPVAITARLSATDSVLTVPALTSLSVLGLRFLPARAVPEILAPSLLGKTFEWDTAENRYAFTGRGGAPRNSVRFILYRLPTRFPNSGPLRPLVETGHTDLVTERTGTGNTGLRSIVHGPGGAPTYANYLVGALFGTNAYTITAGGFLSSGTTRVEVRAGFSADKVSDGADISLDLEGRGIHIRSIERNEYATDTSFTERMDFRLQAGPDAVTMTGTIAVTQTGPRKSSVTADVTFRINGRVFATLAGTDENIAASSREGVPLTLEETQAASRIFTAPGRIHSAIGGLVQPSVNFLSGR